MKIKITQNIKFSPDGIKVNIYKKEDKAIDVPNKDGAELVRLGFAKEIKLENKRRA